MRQWIVIDAAARKRRGNSHHLRLPPASPLFAYVSTRQAVCSLTTKFGRFSVYINKSCKMAAYSVMGSERVTQLINQLTSILSSQIGVDFILNYSLKASVGVYDCRLDWSISEITMLVVYELCIHFLQVNANITGSRSTDSLTDELL